MESPRMLTTLIGKNQDDEIRASDGSMVGKGGNFGTEVSIEGKMEQVGVVKDEGNLVRSSEIGNECIEKGSKCSEIGIEESGLEPAVGELREVVAADCLEGLEDVPVQQSDVGGNKTNELGAVEIPVAELIDEEELPLSKEGIAVSGDYILAKKQNVVQEVDSFTVGDIVWCMAKNNIWWPALICDPSDAHNKTTKIRDSEKYLIRHFGSKSLVWSPPTHLKHFLKCFNEMSSQGKSKSILAAIEKAVEEVGRRLKFEMSCSCISKEVRARLIGQNKEDFRPWYTSNDTAAHHFDPTTFLVRVKNLARMGNVFGLDNVEIVATRSNISAYYSYFGHSQMYMQHLHDSDSPNGDITSLTAEEDMEEDGDLRIEKDGQFLDTSLMEESPKLSAEGTAEKGFESRERRKSKYLSFPFVDPSATKSLRYPMDSSEASGKRSSTSGKRLMGKSITKFTTDTSSGDLKDLKVSPAQLLTELRDTSRGYFYLNGNIILNSTFEFFCEFRHYTFKDGNSGSNLCNKDGIFDKDGLEVHDATPLSEVKPAKKPKKSVINKLEPLSNEPTLGQPNDTSLKACRETPAAKALSKSRKRKELTIANHQGGITVGVLDLNLNGGSSRPHQNSLDKGKVGESNSQTKKRKNELATTVLGHELENGLLEENVERHFGNTTASLNTNAAPIPHANSKLVKVPEQMELLPICIKSDKKLENTAAAETSSGLPDLNGNDLDPNSSATSPKLSFNANMIPAARVEELPISVIESKLEIMTKMLEESGSTISPDMRAKLENDVQGLLKKVKDMNGRS